MNEITKEQLSAYLDGVLSPDERSAVEKALEGSPDLRRELAALERLHALLKDVPPVPPPLGFETRVLRRIRRPSTRWIIMVPSLVAAAASALVMVMVWRDHRPIRGVLSASSRPAPSKLSQAGPREPKSLRLEARAENATDGLAYQAPPATIPPEGKKEKGSPSPLGRGQGEGPGRFQEINAGTRQRSTAEEQVEWSGDSREPAAERESAEGARKSGKRERASFDAKELEVRSDTRGVASPPAPLVGARRADEDRDEKKDLPGAAGLGRLEDVTSSQPIPSELQKPDAEAAKKMRSKATRSEAMGSESAGGGTYDSFVVSEAALKNPRQIPKGQAPAPEALEWRGFDSGIADQRQVVIRTQAEWRALWATHTANVIPAPPAPVLDFAKWMVVGVFMGERPSSGYEVRITAVPADRGQVLVKYTESRPDPAMSQLTVMTQPYHLLAVPKRDLPVKFKRVE